MKICMLPKPFPELWKVQSMAEIDVLSLNKAELHELRKRIDVALEQRELRDKNEALEAAEAAARKSGFSLSDLLGGTTRTRAPKPAKYVDPKDRTRTWSGRGRKPNWYLKALEEGYSEADMRMG